MTWWTWLLVAVWGPTTAAGLVLSTAITVLARFGRGPRLADRSGWQVPSQPEVYPSGQPAWQMVDTQQ